MYRHTKPVNWCQCCQQRVAIARALSYDPDKDSVTKVLGMVLRIAKKHNDNTALKRSFITAAMSLDGIDTYEYEVLKRWDSET